MTISTCGHEHEIIRKHQCTHMLVNASNCINFSFSNLGKENMKFNYVDDLDDTASIAPESQSPKALNQKISYPFLFGSEDFVDGGNRETFLHSSVYIPSAPPLLERNSFNYDAYKEVLEVEPPEWLPDNSTRVCIKCNAPFTVLTRGRNNCRFCGGAKVMDWTCSRWWLNLPVSLSMEQEIYKSVNTLRSYCQVARLNHEKLIPTSCSERSQRLGNLDSCKSAAAGLIGRVVETDLRAREKVLAFATLAVNVHLWGLIRRKYATKRYTNLRFYGDPFFTTAVIPLGTVDIPKAAELLYAAIQDMQSKLQC
ncbi:unnamed protein product [Fraxinus pennsylvanica]|uniref:FYVE zinc finger domain-containing protein n=1 Tax=Fraxinus pennsylvanica TaxID=56036 RepID=A0AAD2AE40_9LAMI|nr:unnamed protein product [Fraxinus pennsylvanica]